MSFNRILDIGYGIWDGEIGIRMKMKMKIEGGVNVNVKVKGFLGDRR